jgi:phage-related minor tail protein
MADFTAKFSMVDEISDKLASMAEKGQTAMSQWEQAGDSASAAFDGIGTSATTSATTADSVATSISSVQEASEGASSAAGNLSETLDNYGASAENAATQTDYWTDAVGNYNTSMLEAVYSTEELVDMGLKSAAALEEEQQMLDLCEQSATYLSNAIEGSEPIQSALNDTINEANTLLSELSDNEKVSAETKEELQAASEAAAEAMQELATAQEEAAAAMENYDSVMASGTSDLNELEAAAERAYHAADDLAEANGKASEATENLSKVTEEASKEADEAGKSGQNAIEGVASALAAAGITATVKEIAESAYELADAFSDAESTVVLATGATGDALDGLTESMMNAYATSKTGTLDETAAAVGEINTRLAYTGDTLTETTEQFLDFAAVTGGNAASSVRSITQLMNQWNVPASQMESVLSKMTYAGQASGISVDSLTSQLTNNKAILDQLGFSLDEATAMFMNFELAGTNSTTVMTGFRKALASGDISSLDELYEVFDQIASGAMSAAQASDLFGSKAGAAIVNAVNGGVLSLDGMVSALENADGTLATTADAAQTLDQKWSQATNNVSAAFTSALEPTFSSISSGLASMVNGVGDFLNEHPAVTKAITAIGIGLGVVVTGMAGVTFATTVAIPAVAAFGTALNAALGPIGWVALAITGVVAAGTALVAMFSDAEDETAGMTEVTRKQYYELQDLNSEYENACEKYGETSEEALRLKYQVDDLSESFEANQQTLEEFEAEVDDLVQSHSELIQSYDDSMTSINQNEQGTLGLIQKLEDLADQTERTAAQDEEMKSIIDQLNEDLPDLALSYDDVTKSTEASIEAMKKAAEEQAEQERQAEQKQAYIDLLKEQANLEDEIAKAEENLRLSQESDDNAGVLTDQWFYDKTGWLGAWATDTDNYSDALDDLNAAYAENQAALEEIESDWEDVAKAAEKAENKTMTYKEAAATAYEGVQEKVEELCKAYDEAYDAALDSFEGQFSLFDTASTKSEDYANATIENAQKAMNSQLEYWKSYSADVDTLRDTSASDLGITEENYKALMSYAQDGSEEAAGLAHSMAEAIKKGDEETVAKLAKTVGKVNDKQEELAAKTADWQTDFTEQMNSYAKDMADTIDDMDLSEKAKKSATNTINGYINAIKAGKSGAVAAAQDVADSVSKALSKASTASSTSGSTETTTTTTTATPAHANGTTNAENMFIAGEAGPELIVSKAAAYANGTTDSDDFYIAGEDGPELIVGQQGSTVFPTQETDRIIDSLSNRESTPLNVEVQNQTGGGSESEESAKKILLEIAGSGAIEVGGNGGASKESILEILTEHLKPTLLGIIQQEIYEEGDYSYEF